MILRCAVGSLIFLSLILTGCVTPLPKALNEVEQGMDKSEVLEVAGNPKITRRQSGRDHWIYVYFENDEEFRQEIHFEQGKVIHIGPKRSVTKEALSPEKAQTMQEFEDRSRKDPNSESDDSGFQDM